MTWGKWLETFWRGKVINCQLAVIYKITLASFMKVIRDSSSNCKP